MRLGNRLLILILLLSNLGFGMDVSVTPFTFHNNSHNYLEIYSRIIANSVQFKSELENESLIFSEIEMLCLLKANDKYVVAEKFSITSPKSETIVDFWDLRRFQVEPGQYDLEITFVDLNNLSDTLRYQQKIDLEFPSDEYGHSNILMISDVDTTNTKFQFEKSGFFFEPLCFNHIPAESQHLIVYTELYGLNNLTSKETFVKYYSTTNEDDQIASVGYHKLKQNDEILLLNVDVSDYLSGNYKFHIEIFDRDKRLLDSYDSHFSVFHPVNDMKSQYELDEIFESSFVQLLDAEDLDYSLKAIFPLVGNNQTETLNYIIGHKNVRAKKYFLYDFWGKMSPDSPRQTYLDFMEVARAVDRKYANNVGYGFETDRGFIFIKYGRPDDMVIVEDEPSAPPYEIWIYNHVPLTQQTNVKFLFYNPSLAGNDFKLLHSTCRGELHNANWEFDLYRDAFDQFNVDGFNKNAKRYFTDF